MSDELKPCPFCGSIPHLADLAGWEIICECGVDLCLPSPGRARLIAAWNRRPPESSERVALTDEQIYWALDKAKVPELRDVPLSYDYQVARAIEAAHGIPSPAESSVQINAKGGE